MKKLKCFLMLSLFAAFASEGFGQTLTVNTSGTTSSYNYNTGNGIVTGTKYIRSNCDPRTIFYVNIEYQDYYECKASYINGIIHYDWRGSANRIRLQQLTNGNWGDVSSQEITTNFPGGASVPGNPRVWTQIPNKTEQMGISISNQENHYRIILEKKLNKFQVFASSQGFSETILGNTWECQHIEYFKLKHIPGIPLSSVLTANGNSYQSNGYSGEHIICGSTPIYLDNITPQCSPNSWNMYLETWNGSSFVNTTATGNLSGLPPTTVNLSNYFSLTTGNKYRIILKVGKNGVWSNDQDNMYTIDYRQSYTPVINVTSGSNSICAGDPVTLEVSNYSSAGGLIWSTGNSNPAQFDLPNTTTTYTVTFADICTQSVSQTITVKPNPTIDLSANNPFHCTNEDLNLVWNLTASVNPPGGSGYWNSSDWVLSANNNHTFNPQDNLNDIPGIGTVTYYYTQNGCSSSKDFTFGFYDESQLSTTVDNVTCLGSNDGVIIPSAVGFPSFSYTLNGTTATPPFTNLSGGNYDVNLTDGHGCVTSNTVTVTEAATALSANLNQANPYALLCNGANVNISVINVVGGIPPYQYNFGSGYSSTSNDDLAAGQHTVYVKDNNGCEILLPITITQPATAINSTSYNITPATCIGLNTGQIAFSVNGGTPPYSIYISGAGNFTSSPATGISGGNHTITVTDANGCTKVDNNVYVGYGPSGIVLNPAVITPELCSGVGNGSITVSLALNSPVQNATYNWSNGSTGATITNLTGGSYTVTATAPGGCQEIETYVVATGATKWQRTTNNTNGNEDNIIKVISDPATHDVYVLGEFVDETSLDAGVSNIVADATGNNPTQKGIFVAKYNECGGLEWSVNSERTDPTSSLNIDGVDIQFKGNDIIVFCKYDIGLNTSLNLEGSSSNSYSIMNNDISKDIFSFDVSSAGVISTNSVVFYQLNFTDIINQVSYVQSGNGNQAIFGGQFNQYAGVKVFDYGSNSFTNTDPIIDSEPDNEIAAFVWYDGEIYAVANIMGMADFGLGRVYANGQQEAVILHSDGRRVDNMNPANASDFVKVTDIDIDDRDNLWVTMQFNEEVSNWSGIASHILTGMLVQFEPRLQPIQSFSLDGSLTESSANALSIYADILYVAGEFTGQIMAIGNPNTGYSVTTTSPGSIGSSDLWLAKIYTNDPVFAWIEGTSSIEATHVNDVTYDGLHSHTVGNYRSDIYMPVPGGPMSIPTQLGLTYPSNFGGPLGFVLRGGDLGTSTPKFYKTGNGSTDITETKNELDADISTALVISPNPNNGEFTIQFNNELDGNLNLTIYDVTGKLVYQQVANKTSNSFNKSISLQQLQAGIYVLRLEMNETVSYQKFMIK